MRTLRATIVGGLACAIAGGVLLAGCELANVEPPRRDLDAELEAALTLDGQRRLDEFYLPASDDFSEIPQDPANALTAAKVELGKLLFHETALATSPLRSVGAGTYSCATCHHAAAGFQAGRQQSIGEGGSGWGTAGEGRIPDPGYADADVDAPVLRSPTVLNSAFQRLMHWDGSMGAGAMNEGTEAAWLPGTPSETNALGFEGLETQAIAALTVHRMSDLDSSIVVNDATYSTLWEEAFPGEPVTLVNVGLAIAAYERTVMANRAPFQRWLRGEYNAMSDVEKRGALVFVGKGLCETCHTGPALSSMAFYALGMADLKGPPDLGRGAFLGDPAEAYKFKVPQLYNMVDSPFLGHGGTFGTVREVVEYYNDAIPDIDVPPEVKAPRFQPLHLTQQEMDELVVFLEVSLRDPDLMRYQPASVPSGNCIPANDPVARADLGC